MFHFITPNGHEDVWKHSPSELLINHVNYFYGKGLLKFLLRQGFSPLQYYSYKLKTSFRGRGWKVRDTLMAPVSKKSRVLFVLERKGGRQGEESLKKEDVLDKRHIRQNRKGITYLIFWYHYAKLFRLPPELNVGHEIFGLFRIMKSSKN